MPVPEEDLCEHYGSFMHEVQRPYAEAMFWVFFVTVLFILFAASWRFGRVVERNEGVRVDDPARQARVYKCFYISMVAGVISLIIIIMECFVLLALQFCDNEPLSSLYWSVWTVLQVGAVVAVFGISLHTRHMIKGRKHPPWALALGTPVLVVAGLGHYFQGKIRRGTKKIAASASRSRSRSRHQRGRTRVKYDQSLSEAPTVRDDSTDSGSRSPQAASECAPTVYGDLSDKFNAKIIGYTKEGDVIIRISPELSQEMHMLKPQSSITWDEPRVQVPPPPQINIESELKEDEAGTPRKGRSRHRSSSSVTFKGKEKELSVHQQTEPAQRQQDSAVNNFTTELPKAYQAGQPYSVRGELDARNSHRQLDHDRERLSPIQPVSPLSESIRRTRHEYGDDSLRLARLADWLPNLADQAEQPGSPGRAI